MKRFLISLFAASLIGASANAHLIDQDQIAQGSNSNPTTEISVLEAWAPSLSSLVYLAKYDYDDAMWDGAAPFGAANFSASLYSGTPAEATIMWDLAGTGYKLTAVVVKTARTYLTVYKVSSDQMITDVGGQTVQAPDNKDSISHISFFGQAIAVPDSGSTFALLGLCLVGLAAVRRFKK